MSAQKRSRLSEYRMMLHEVVLAVVAVGGLLQSCQERTRHAAAYAHLAKAINDGTKAAPELDMALKARK